MSVTRQIVRLLDKRGGQAGTATTGPAHESLSDLMVFNYLLNSRADNGFAYWINNGWTVDASRGRSGMASFRCEGASGLTKTLSQTVRPSHRDSYTLSLAFETENIVKGPNGRVGVEIVIRYTDGSEETQFLELA